MKELIKKIFRLKARMSFARNASLGMNFSCGPRASCVNESKNASNIIIGSNVDIMGQLYTQGEGIIVIGNYSTIRYGSSLQSADKIEIGDYAIISNNVIITDNNSHPTEPEKRIEMLLSGFYGDAWKWKHAESSPVKIEKNVWIGQRAIVLKGVTIGEGSIVASMAVVTKDVPPYSLVAGNPGKVVRKLR